MEEWLDYEAMTFALGDDMACPECGMGILLPIGSEEAQRLCVMFATRCLKLLKMMSDWGVGF